ncbi:hypothetical protein Aab01nite_51740 [Paractinoplanes abujensis]|uniref:Uncharacterized protein n=1 Tax=Paractinoplanes abujensis TaxID=882441 RepID=A0A7W7G145_9ACTN|nr:hypothetical protein [Actinoplanes abujensis]MBB4693758.1 hypothetical protein [Actinoplanes abujensis]GID21584.1 hypothetical protein Aab01nite_51740 [Actinoplanes abujensis]
MTFLWETAGQPEIPAPRVRLWSRRGLLRIALGGTGWLLLLPLRRLVETSALGGPYVGLAIFLGAFVVAALVSTAVILFACARSAWGVAAVSLLLAVVAGIAAVPRDYETGYVDYQFRKHRTALASLAQDYRAGRLEDDGLTLPPDLRALSPSGYAYAGDTVLFVQLWQNWRAEAGTGLAYLTQPPTAETRITTASGDFGYPRRRLGDGWWWVA